ncbi:MAG: response regulator [Actinobacteria bacterium]|nr:response regulator [Actinomycetota bacterium]
MAGGRPLRVLCLDDSSPDVELVAATLTRAGYQLELDWAADRTAFEALLAGAPYDVILADCALPGFDAHEALELAEVACPGTPFICVSGTIGEEITVELLKRGADDIVLKDRMARLPFAVQRAVDERAGAATLAGSEQRFRSLFENLLKAYAYCRMIYDGSGEPVDFVYLEVNPAFKLLTGLKDVEGRPVSEVIPGVNDLSPELLGVCDRVARTGAPETIEFDFKSLGIWLFISVYSTEPGTFIAVFEDITGRREAEQAQRRQEEAIRRAYVDVLDAVTGGKLILLSEETFAGELGQPLSEVVPISSPSQLAEARRVIVAAAELRYPGRLCHTDVLGPLCEALNNALKHAGGGTYQVFAGDGRLQVAIADKGPGIDFGTLPRATLVRGFSTAASLGMGFTIMLQLCDRVLLCTRPGHTGVVLEVAAARAGGRTSPPV